MKLSTKCRYGLRAALEIARNFGKSPAKRKDIARKEELSSSYLENILLVLRNQKIIETTRGANGGYVLCRPPSAISVYEIVAALEGPLSIVDCVDGPDLCKQAGKCTTRSVWCELSAAIRGVLQNMTLQDLLDKENRPRAGDYSI
jgi:Rrf2 family transcriptional regulator, cysteine metabolism repressor